MKTYRLKVKTKSKSSFVYQYVGQLCALPKKIFPFLSGNGTFWFIMAACFNVSIRRVNELKLNRVDIAVVHKKEQERRSDAFASDSNTASEASLETISGYILYTASESQKRQKWNPLGLLSK